MFSKKKSHCSTHLYYPKKKGAHHGGRRTQRDRKRHRKRGLAKSPIFSSQEEQLDREIRKEGGQGSELNAENFKDVMCLLKLADLCFSPPTLL